MPIIVVSINENQATTPLTGILTQRSRRDRPRSRETHGFLPGHAQTPKPNFLANVALINWLIKNTAASRHSRKSAKSNIAACNTAQLPNFRLDNVRHAVFLTFVLVILFFQTHVANGVGENPRLEPYISNIGLYPRHISTYRRDRKKIPTANPNFDDGHANETTDGTARCNQ